jgi:hypothetical protein
VSSVRERSVRGDPNNRPESERRILHAKASVSEQDRFISLDRFAEHQPYPFSAPNDTLLHTQLWERQVQELDVIAVGHRPKNAAVLTLEGNRSVVVRNDRRSLFGDALQSRVLGRGGHPFRGREDIPRHIVMVKRMRREEHRKNTERDPYADRCAKIA